MSGSTSETLLINSGFERVSAGDLVIQTGAATTRKLRDVLLSSGPIPVATSNTPGIVKPGAGLAVAGDGTLTTTAVPASGGTNQTVRVVSAPGTITATSADAVIVVRKATGAVTAVTLESAPATGRVLTIKDGLGDAATNAITITPASGTIDGAATMTVSANYAAVTLVYNGYEWGGI